MCKRTAAGKVLCDKAFNIAKYLKYDGYQFVLASLVYKFFKKKSFGTGVKSKIMSKLELAEELHKPIVRRCFQYKILHNTLYLNQKLFLFHKHNISFCSFCHLEDETFSFIFLFIVLKLNEYGVQ